MSTDYYIDNTDKSLLNHDILLAEHSMKTYCHC